jgi:hypothetical protein
MQNMQTDLLLPVTGTNNTHTNIFDVPADIYSARPAAFPGFNIAQVTEEDLGIAFPVKVFRAIFGITTSHDLAMSISIPQAEDIELPADDAFAALSYYCEPNPLVRRCDLATPQMKFFVGDLCQPEKLQDTILTPRIVFVNHVYYARQINYAYTTKGGAALGVSVAMAAAASAKNEKSSSSDNTKSSVSDNSKTTATSSGETKSPPPSSGGDQKSSPSAAATNTSEPRTDAEKEAQALRSRLNEIQQELGTTGGKLQVVTANSDGTLLSQTFSLPIAIGYRGLGFNLAPPGTYCDISTQGAPHTSHSAADEVVR